MGLRVAFCASKCATHSLLETVGLQAGQSSNPYPLPPQPGLCNVCRMWFCIVLSKYAWTSLEKMSSWRQHIVLQNLYVLFSINGAITEVQVTFARALTNPIPWQTLAFGLVAGNSLDDPFLLWSGAHGVHSSQKIPEILIHSDHITTFPLCDGPSQMPPSPEKSMALLDTVNIGLPFGTVQF